MNKYHAGWREMKTIKHSAELAINNLGQIVNEIENFERKARCKVCEGTGIRIIPNGPDDIDKDYCTCEAGHLLEEKNND